MCACVQVVRYKHTTCAVESSFYSMQFVCPCTSGPTGSKHHCPSYPCLLVHVSLNNTQYTRQVTVVPLFIDDRQQAVVHDAATDELEMVSSLHVFYLYRVVHFYRATLCVARS